MAPCLMASGVLWACHDLLTLQVDRNILRAGPGLLLNTVYVLRLLPACVVRLVCWTALLPTTAPAPQVQQMVKELGSAAMAY
jgi:hypothetical protein